MRVFPFVVATLLAVPVTVSAQSSKCAPTDSAAASQVRARLTSWVQDANRGDRTRMNEIWSRGLTGWFPKAGIFSDSVSVRLAAGAGAAAARPVITYELTIDDIRASGALVVVHDVWLEKRSYAGLERSTQRTIRSSELWTCEDDGQWRISRYVSAPEPWEVVASSQPRVPVGAPNAAVAPNADVAAARAVWRQAQSWITRAATQMPADKFSYRPVETVRTFGETVAHIASSQFSYCAAVLGETATEQDLERTARDRDALIAALQRSADYCAKAYAITDELAAGSVRLYGQNVTRLNVLITNAAHDHEHYGNIATYMRMNGMVPPSSQTTTAR